MSKRLQKKLFRGEFAVMGFGFSTSLSDFSDDQFDGFFDALILYVESQSLVIGGGGTKDNFTGYITKLERYSSATDADRTALEAWLKAQSGTSDVTIEPLTDAYHG